MLNRAFLKDDRISWLSRKSRGIRGRPFIRGFIPPIRVGVWIGKAFPLGHSFIEHWQYYSDVGECDRGRRIASVLRSERFGMKSRGRKEDLESREPFQSNYRNLYIGELQVVESLDIQCLLVDVEFALNWGPCFAITRWVRCGSRCFTSVRTSPPYRDWITSVPPPVLHDDLIIESQLRRRFSLFGLSQDADTQTDGSVALGIAVRNSSPSSQNSRPGPVAAAGLSAVAPWKAPPYPHSIRSVVFGANRVPISTHGWRENFLRVDHLPDPRIRRHQPRRPHPRLMDEPHVAN